MPISKEYETPATGAVASYHVVQVLTMDKMSKGISVSLYSYLSAEACASGKAQMFQQQIMIAAWPDAGVDAFDFAEEQLVAALPAADIVAMNPTRYAFSGAEIVT